jgi:DNA-binding MarR family transcriptional regulator
MNFEDAEDFEQLAALVSGFANPTRLALLLGFYQGYTATDMTDFLGVSRPGAQKNINRMVDADLVYRPAADDTPTYALTPIGKFFARIFDGHADNLLGALDLLAQKEAQLEKDLENSPLAEGLDQTDEDKLIHTKKWADIATEINEKLTQPQIRIHVPANRTKELNLQNRITTAVAKQEGVEPSKLPTLYPAIDMDALEQLLQPDSKDSFNPAHRVTFEYAGYTVVISTESTASFAPIGEDSTASEDST